MSPTLTNDSESGSSLRSSVPGPIERVSVRSGLPPRTLIPASALAKPGVLPRTVALIKSHQVTYLPRDLNRLVGRLAPGERTPLFLLGTTWDRFTWYLRLPGGAGAPWAGVVRLECSADLPADQAIQVANLAQVSLPRFASESFREPRAPQNLYPIGGLERELRHRLGDPGLLRRELQVAAVRSIQGP